MEKMLPILHSSALTIFDLHTSEAIRDKLKAILDRFEKQKAKVLPIVLRPNFEKHTLVSQKMAIYSDLSEELEALISRKDKVSDSLMDRLKDVAKKNTDLGLLEKECKALYKRIAQKIHPDKLTEKDEALTEFYTQATSYLEALDIESLTTLILDISIYLGEESSQQSSTPLKKSPNILALKISLVKQETQLLQKAIDDLGHDEFTRVVQIYDIHGEIHAVLFYSKVLDVQIDFYREKILKLRRQIQDAIGNYSEFNVHNKKFTFED
jgi:hypothetical protein